jgi:uncharacterized membrane protein
LCAQSGRPAGFPLSLIACWTIYPDELQSIGSFSAPGGHPVIAKNRLDGLTDAVFGVAMTLLVIDLRLPESFHPREAAELWRAIADLSTQFLAYAISFFVLAPRWVALAKLAAHTDRLADRFVAWSLVHLFLVACFPFSTMLVGRYVEFAPSVWVYAANTILAALVMLRLVRLAGAPTEEPEHDDWQAGLLALIVVALVSVGISFVRPADAMWAYLLLATAPAWQKWLARRTAR